MARRLIKSLDNFPSPSYLLEYREVKVYRDSEWNEYRVCFYVDGSKQMGADYHTDSKSDALHTAEQWVNAYSLAVQHMRALVAQGKEYPDAHWEAFTLYRQHGISSDTLQTVYDQQGKA